MWKLISMFILMLGATITTLVGIIRLIRLMIIAIQKRDCQAICHVLKRNLIVFCIFIAILILLVGITQITASTPAILDSNGQVMEGSIAQLRKVELNGRKEWITIRGNDKTAPVLLFLAGGPGGSQLAATRYDLSELEKDFVVVNWDQPGSAKSYLCIPGSKITPETYIEDGIALTESLREEFGKDKIYLVGESWGSALGIFLIKEKPEYYHALIGAGQMVDFIQTDVLDYQIAMELAKQDNDQKLIDKMLKEGEPPYYNGNLTMRSLPYLSKLSTYMTNHPDNLSQPFHMARDLCASEYGLLDSINYIVGIINTYNRVYTQLYGTDLRTEYNKLEVPVYFFLGRFDVNAPTSLVEDYNEVLQAPEKEIVWFEHSGHTPWTYETPRFLEELRKRFTF